MKLATQKSVGLPAMQTLALAQEPANARTSGEALPLSFSQQRLWLIDQLHPKSSAYNVPTAFRISGFLNINALKSSLEAIVERHEILRTVYTVMPEGPVQNITDRIAVEFPLIDLSSYPEAEQQKELSRLLMQEAERPFDLNRDLMLRAILFRLNVKEHVLFLNIHHIACDEWSMEILFRELTALYQSFCEKKPPPLRELPVQYADFAVWQRERMRGELLHKQLNYWRQQLSGELPVLELPLDQPRPLERTNKGRSVSRAFSYGLANSIKNLCQRENVTPFLLLLTAFKILLYRYTAEEDIIVGAPISGRNRVETENLIGFFVNTLALRTRVDPALTFGQLLQRVREVAMGAISFQDLPFEKLVEELQPERSTSQNPLFNVMFTFQNAPEPISIPGLTITPVELESTAAKFDLTLAMQHRKDGITALLEFNADIFERDTAEKFLTHLETLLDGIVAHPEQQIARLPLLTLNERQRILEDWNHTTTEFPAKTSVHELFEAQAERTPDAIAASYGENAITYREMNERANQVAHFLCKLGVGPKVLVGVCLERSIEMIVAWLGILKAGGAYVPLDLSYPGKRLEFMAADTQMPFVLTQKKFQSRLPDSLKKICLDADWKQISRENKSAPLSRVASEAAAYVIYTSGSTGKPKGVIVPHQAITRLICNTNYISLQPDDRIAQASNSSFDAATFEIWGALLCGAHIVGISQDVLLSPRALAAELRQKQITTIFLTTALFNQIAADAPDAFRTLKHVLFGGEACDPKSVKTILASAPPRRLLHVYGPTETTTFASWFEVNSVPEGATTLPIGRPISNTTFFVLDKNLQPVPIGIPGELYIGGAGVACGYLNRPELNEEKFVPNPFRPGTRLYKTGDLARFLPDGNVGFLGRSDNQVKIRGFRIELEEIEIALEQHRSVRDAVVIARDSNGGKQLVAYIVPQNNARPPIEELRSFLKPKLPEFMLPSVFAFLESLPLTPNGKVNRQALPASADLVAASQTYLPARSSLENQLTKIWENVLQRKPIGVRDNFFELGGHSLLAVRLFTQIEHVLGQKLPPSTLFQTPTVEQLAKIISRKAWSSPGASLVEIQPKGTRPPIFWLHTLGGGGGGGLFTYRKLAELLGPDQPSYGLVTPPDPFTKIETMAAHYISEMQTLQPNGPYYLGGYCFGGVIAFEMARQLQAQGEKIGLLALIESMPPNSTSGSKRTASFAMHFLKTFPAWLAYIASLGPRGIFVRFRKKLTTAVKQMWKADETPTVEEQISKVFDFSIYPADFKRYAEIHWLALNQYQPRPFPGRAILLRTNHPHLLDLAPEQLWAKLILGGVEAKIVPGTHEKILQEPYVEVLANKLRTELEQSAAGIEALAGNLNAT